MPRTSSWQDANAASQLTGKFPISQDQRNTVRLRIRYQFLPRLWFAAGLESDSGLPFEFTGTQEDALAQSGQRVIDRLDFDRGRVRPSLSVDASIGADIYKSDFLKMRIQADARNLTNRLNVIDFQGLLSGNAIAPPRAATSSASPPPSDHTGLVDLHLPAT